MEEETSKDDQTGFKFPPKANKQKNTQTNTTYNKQSNNSQASTKPVTPITIPNEETFFEIKWVQTKGKHSNKLRKEILDNNHQKYYCKNIDEEKLINVLIKDIPKFVKIEDICDVFTNKYKK